MMFFVCNGEWVQIQIINKTVLDFKTEQTAQCIKSVIPYSLFSLPGSAEGYHGPQTLGGFPTSDHPTFFLLLRLHTVSF